jgi:hypothetical protein
VAADEVLLVPDRVVQHHHPLAQQLHRTHEVCCLSVRRVSVRYTLSHFFCTPRRGRGGEERTQRASQRR